MNFRMLPPVAAGAQSIAVKGRAYSAAPGSILDVVDADAGGLASNGWTKIAFSGPTSGRPTTNAANGPYFVASPGMHFLDTIINAMIVFDGLSALSAFRLERINREFQRLELRSKLVAAWNVYFVRATPNTQDLETEKLRDVLRATPGDPRPADIWTVPRLGTISPWSSKATDILRGCGFPIERVEHGFAYAIERAPAAVVRCRIRFRLRFIWFRKRWMSIRYFFSS